MTLSGCVQYAAKPVAPGAFPAALDARVLNEKPAGAVWSGADLLQTALARNPSIAEARAKYRTAQAAARTARLVPGLTLTLTGEYADEKPNWGYGAAADLPLDVGVRRGSRVTTADLQALQAFYDLGEAAWKVMVDLEKARAELTSANAGIVLADQAADLRRQRLERLEQRVAAGQDPRSVTLLAATDRVAADRRAADARTRRETALVALAKALGVSPAAARSLTLAPPTPPPPLTDLAAWRRDAALSRSDVLRAVADYDIAESALRLEVAKQYPEVRIGPGYQYDHGVNKLPFNLTLALPSYDLNRRAIDQAEAARAAAGRTLEVVQAQSLAAVDTAAVALASAQAEVERTETRDLPNARRTATNVARSLAAGETDRPDDLAARAVMAEAELTLLDARRAAAMAAVDLEDALRRPFDPAQGAVLQSVISQPGGAQ